MDILYPLINSSFGNIELMFSLRSLEKFGNGVDNIFIIGDKPGFLDYEKVRHYDFVQNGVKDYNIAKKVDFSCGLRELSDDFLFCNDDHFFTQEFEVSDYPYYHKGDLGVDVVIDNYQNYLNTTKGKLLELGKPTKHFDVHCPIIYNKEKFLKLRGIWNENVSYVVKSIYCNYYEIEGEKYSDVKLQSLISESDFERAKKNVCFSVYDGAMNRGVFKWLAENYNQPSKWEKPDTQFAFEVLREFTDTKEKVFRTPREVFVVNNDRAMEILSKAPRGFLKISNIF